MSAPCFTLIVIETDPAEDHVLLSPSEATLRAFGQGFYRGSRYRPTVVLFDPQGRPIAHLGRHDEDWTEFGDTRGGQPPLDLAALQHGLPARHPITHIEARAA